MYRIIMKTFVFNSAHPSCTTCLEDSLTLLRALIIAHLHLRSVTFPHCVSHCLLSKGNLTSFLKILRALFFLCRIKLLTDAIRNNL